MYLMPITSCLFVWHPKNLNDFYSVAINQIRYDLRSSNGRQLGAAAVDLKKLLQWKKKTTFHGDDEEGGFFDQKQGWDFQPGVGTFGTNQNLTTLYLQVFFSKQNKRKLEASESFFCEKLRCYRQVLNHIWA